MEFMEDNISEEEEQLWEKTIPIFTVLKNGVILRNIFVLNSRDFSSSERNGSTVFDDDEVEEILVVGRHPDCDILLTHPSISRFHLEIRSIASRQKLFITDLSSELLNSQQIPESPEVPLFSPHDEPEPLEDIGSDVVHRRKWTATEDVVLCSAWLNTSKDPVVGNEQMLGAFWHMIGQYFNSSPKLVGYEKREAGKCKQRWHKISDQVNKFVGYFEAAQRQKSSGQNDDVLKVAYTLFSQDHSVKFNLEHAWIELRNDQKWCASSTLKGDGGSRKRKVDETGNCHTPIDSGAHPMACPEGVKAAKAKAKAKGSVSKGSVGIGGEGLTETSELFQNMWSIKEKDFALQASQSKISMLQSLLAKQEPLEEIEIALKNRLIGDFLSNV